MPAMNQQCISVVIPCYNEETSILGVLHEVSETLSARGIEHELIVIDDGSTDGTAECLAGSSLPAKVIRHETNRGYGASLKEGIRVSRHDLVVTMDSDGQHPPENIVVLLDEAQGHDLVIGARRQQGSHHWRRPGKLLLKLMCEFLVGQRIPAINSGFRLLRKNVALNYLHLCSEQFSFSTSITLCFLSDRLGVKFVPIDIRARQGGASQVKIKTGFSTIMLILRIAGTFNPLPIFMPPSIVMFMIGWALATWGLIMERNVGDVAVLMLITGIMLFCFGLLADQLALLRREINRKR